MGELMATGTGSEQAASKRCAFGWVGRGSGSRAERVYEIDQDGETRVDRTVTGDIAGSERCVAQDL
jgi:hypothetical protein